MSAYRQVYGFDHLRADCRGPGSAPEPYARFEYGIIFFTIFTTNVGCSRLVVRYRNRNLSGCSHLSYPDRLVRLNLGSLVVRRLRHDLILTYKIIFDLTDMNPEDFFTFANSNHNTRGHAYKLLPSHCRVNVRKGFFFAERVVKP